MKKILAVLVWAVACAAFGQEYYVGLYMQGSKLGYSSYSVADETLNGKPVKRTDSKTVMNVGMLGSAMSMKMSSTSWTDAANRPIRMKFLMESSGRTQLIDASFSGQKINVVSDNSGNKTTKTLSIPTGGQVIEDPILPLLEGGAKAGAKQAFYVLDPMTISLVKTTTSLKGPGKVTVKGKEYNATVINIDDPRAPMTVYVSAKGDLIKAEGPMGIEMIGETKEEALGNTLTKYEPSVDLALSSSIKTDKPVTNPTTLKRLVLQITGQDLSRLPSDEHQTVKKKGSAWTVDIHPPVQNTKGAVTIAAAAKAKPEWTKPSTHVSSNNAAIKALSKKIVGTEKNVLVAALKVRRHVFGIMKGNPGIGVLRDAVEVLKTKEGVCRDYAILTAALMRAANIPTRLTSGLVNWDGTFYYHAWVEIWDGKRWIGMDSTAPYNQITPSHVKLSHGNVEDAYVFTFLDKVKVEVLSMQRK